MRIALTGASGYVGGTLLGALRRAGHETQAWSRRICPEPWHPYALTDDPARLPWGQTDALVHAAHDLNARGARENETRNIKPSIALLHSALKGGLKHLIYISSMSSYPGTRSHYGQSKLAVEREWLSAGGIVIRPGLVWGDQPGGIMGSLENTVIRLPLIPYLTGPRGLPQYLVHESDLADAILRALESDPAPAGQMIEAAHPEAVSFRDLLTRMANRTGHKKAFIPVPWQVAMLALKAAETIHLPAPFRSDSLTGLVHGPMGLQSDAGLLRLHFRPFA